MGRVGIRRGEKCWTDIRELTSSRGVLLKNFHSSSFRSFLMCILGSLYHVAVCATSYHHYSKEEKNSQHNSFLKNFWLHLVYYMNWQISPKCVIYKDITKHWKRLPVHTSFLLLLSSQSNLVLRMVLALDPIVTYIYIYVMVNLSTFKRFDWSSFWKMFARFATFTSITGPDSQTSLCFYYQASLC